MRAAAVQVLVPVLSGLTWHAHHRPVWPRMPAPVTSVANFMGRSGPSSGLVERSMGALSTQRIAIRPLGRMASGRVATYELLSSGTC
jgi:hypothetical protein